MGLISRVSSRTYRGMNRLTEIVDRVKWLVFRPPPSIETRAPPEKILFRHKFAAAMVTRGRVLIPVLSIPLGLFAMVLGMERFERGRVETVYSQKALKILKNDEKIDKLLGKWDHRRWYIGYDVKFVPFYLFRSGYPCAESETEAMLAYRLFGKKRNVICMIRASKLEHQTSDNWEVDDIYFNVHKKGKGTRRFLVYDRHEEK